MSVIFKPLQTNAYEPFMSEIFTTVSVFFPFSLSLSFFLEVKAGARVSHVAQVGPELVT